MAEPTTTQVNPANTPNKFHILLANDEERTVRAAHATVETSGALALRTVSGDLLVAYAPGGWTYCELERVDDKG
jgi:hypothetical protein